MESRLEKRFETLITINKINKLVVDKLMPHILTALA